ncbi:type II toxin-antitoxin system HipA family toxin [Alloalcanivorax xenomutans]|uniref:Type II toxin-antitoxin system HipA family toxin n=1 Tax=Alloalcanivorax xenomutans TaxID=1094342 RepID=A0A9Q3VZ03_9GAMM|nr:type II toxin-antitoxin system HipA family toxin [Alloalcanivorax xenomutans]MCE7507665.1 type II toxin-antitoxin system HipA family toxin [Alloalcanivorax xenomutans]WOA33073.1 type II toxin-antitoxin system HipA family toxin [Alloalcanivorax xenomutans]
MASVDELDVTSGNELAGRLSRSARHAGEEYSFAYRTDEPERAVSLTMPLRTASYQFPRLHPAFAQNLPEGYLRDAVRRTVSKLHGASDLALLAALGPYQIGRLGYVLPGQATEMAHSTERLETLLDSDNPDLFAELVEKYALNSGISGVQPKLLVDVAAEPPRDKAAIRSSRLIVKAWGTDYPDLALNEYFCMRAASRAGLDVPRFDVSRDGRLFIMERFDVTETGAYLGFEDGCVLQGLSPEEKYDGTYERLARAVSEFVSPALRQTALASLFRSIVLSWAVRNGDAHLKNFGVIYDRPGGTVALAPAYDIVTTTAYLRNDVPALHLAGSKRWWPLDRLAEFGARHCAQNTRQVKETIGAVGSALTTTLPELKDASPRFPDVAPAMIKAWEEAVNEIAAWA